MIWKWSENDPKMIGSWSDHDPKMIRKWSENDPKMIQKNHLLTNKKLSWFKKAKGSCESYRWNFNFNSKSGSQFFIAMSHQNINDLPADSLFSVLWYKKDATVLCCTYAIKLAKNSHRTYLSHTQHDTHTHTHKPTPHTSTHTSTHPHKINVLAIGAGGGTHHVYQRI